MKVFTTGQVAKICKVAPRTVSKWFDSGRLKGYRIPGSQDRRIPREYLIKFLKEHGMPLGDLEDEAMAKVLIVAQDQVLIENLKRELPLERSFKLAVAASGQIDMGQAMAADGHAPPPQLRDLPPVQQPPPRQRTGTVPVVAPADALGDQEYRRAFQQLGAGIAQRIIDIGISVIE